MTVRQLRELCQLAEAQLGPDAVVMFRSASGCGPWAKLQTHMVGAEKPPQQARLTTFAHIQRNSSS